MQKPSTVLDPHIGEEKDSGTSGPRIRCPRCQWSPRKDDTWACTCGHMWNTFDTGGVCPACLHQWTEAQCLSCHQWSPHSEWYAE
jgi:predicted amidophosphoribosyltransferase